MNKVATMAIVPEQISCLKNNSVPNKGRKNKGIEWGSGWMGINGIRPQALPVHVKPSPIPHHTILRIGESKLGFSSPSSKMARLPQLPLELIIKILAISLEEEPVCAFNLLAPEWNLCGRQHGELETLLRSTRFDTYTVLEGGQGHLSTTFDHCSKDCIHLPLMHDPRGLPPLEPYLDRELIKEWSGTNTMEFGQTPWYIGPLSDPELARKVGNYPLLRHPLALDLIPFHDPVSTNTLKAMVPPVPGTTGAPMTFIYERIQHLVLNTVPSLWDLKNTDFGTMPDDPQGIAPGVLEAIDAQLAVERSFHLIADWAAMTRLESVFLDVRPFSRDKLGEADIAAAACGLAGRGLKLLVVAGLRSFEYYTGPEPMEMGPDSDAEYDGKDGGRAYNPCGWDWIRLFRDAVRPGGKLILVDKQLDAIRPLPLCRSDQLTTCK